MKVQKVKLLKKPGLTNNTVEEAANACLVASSANSQWRLYRPLIHKCAERFFDLNPDVKTFQLDLVRYKDSGVRRVVQSVAGRASSLSPNAGKVEVVRGFVCTQAEFKTTVIPAGRRIYIKAKAPTVRSMSSLTKSITLPAGATVAKHGPVILSGDTVKNV